MTLSVGAESESSYAGLQMSEVGLRSVYSGIGNSNTRYQPETEAASSNYKTLETSDDGLRLVYTEAGHTNTDTQSHAAPEGAYAILEMSDNTLTSANTEFDDNKPANDGEQRIRNIAKNARK
ncbi:uncharacterized protein [Littorina saxatilis]|uniref:uncharacterized protein n=1 Tax=Littorina saxatilis TaxID=31220 RepID=UPI0038B42CAD